MDRARGLRQDDLSFQLSAIPGEVSVVLNRDACDFRGDRSLGSDRPRLGKTDQRLHFGLGTATQVEKLEIRWPSGLRESVNVPGVDRILTIVEGKGVVDDKKKDDKKAEKKKEEKKR